LNSIPNLQRRVASLRWLGLRLLCLFIVFLDEFIAVAGNQPIAKVRLCVEVALAFRILDIQGRVVVVVDQFWVSRVTKDGPSLSDPLLAHLVVRLVTGRRGHHFLLHSDCVVEHLAGRAAERWSRRHGDIEEFFDARFLLLFFEHLPLHSFFILSQIEIYLIIPLLSLHVLDRLFQLQNIPTLRAVLRVVFWLQGIAQLSLGLWVDFCAGLRLGAAESTGGGRALLLGELHLLFSYHAFHILRDVFYLRVVHFFDSALQLNLRFYAGLRSYGVWPVIPDLDFAQFGVLVIS